MADKEFSHALLSFLQIGGDLCGDRRFHRHDLPVQAVRVPRGPGGGGRRGTRRGGREEAEGRISRCHPWGSRGCFPCSVSTGIHVIPPREHSQETPPGPLPPRRIGWQQYGISGDCLFGYYYRDAPGGTFGPPAAWAPPPRSTGSLRFGFPDRRGPSSRRGGGAGRGLAPSRLCSPGPASFHGLRCTQTFISPTVAPFTGEACGSAQEPWRTDLYL